MFCFHAKQTLPPEIMWDMMNFIDQAKGFLRIIALDVCKESVIP